jgi:LPS-assembly protein
MHAQLLTNRLPDVSTSVAAVQSPSANPDASSNPSQDAGARKAGAASDGHASDEQGTSGQDATTQIPDDPSQQLLPVAKPEPAPLTGVPVHWESLHQSRVGDDWTLEGEVVLFYKNYVVHADKIVYHQAEGLVIVEGHVQMEGGASDAVFTASHGEIYTQRHAGRFYDVTGSFGVRHVGKVKVYSTPNPFLFTGRVLVQTDEGVYHIVDGSMTSCRLPKPDWQLISRSIDVVHDKATTHNSLFELLKVPLFYLPFVQHNINESGRESGLMIDGFENSGVKGLVLGEQVYWAINRSMDLTVGAQYWSRRGFAPNGVFRYRGPGVDNLTVRWSALLDRGIEATIPATATTPATEEQLNQGGADILAFGRKDLSPNTRVGGSVEYLSSYIYRLAFDENLAQATSSEVQSDAALTHNRHGFVPSISLERFQSFAGTTSTNGAPVTSVPEARILHLPALRFDVVDQPFPGIKSGGPYWGLGSSVGDLDRAEPEFHARNVGRLDVYPHLEWPLHLGTWSVVPQVALRLTQYSGSQIPDLTGTHFGGVPFVQHDPLTRTDVEASVDVRPPALERDFTVNRWNREIRHVIEPEFFYRYVAGIHSAQDTLQFDMTDIATNTNEAGFSLTQRFYLRPLTGKPCHTKDGTAVEDGDGSANGADGADTTAPTDLCKAQPREWASWQIAQKFFANSDFSGALISGRRNIFDTTLDQTGVAFLTAPRNIAPVISRMRFEAIDRLRIEWDFDYDTIAGRMNANNLFAGYSWNRTTIGVGRALLNAADEAGSTASVIKSQQLTPFLYIGKPSDPGLSVGMNASYDFTHEALQYGGVEAIYNWNCCGLNVGYRRFALGSLRDESEWLWGFTLAGIGTAGDIHRSNSVFPTPEALNRAY